MKNKMLMVATILLLSNCQSKPGNKSQNPPDTVVTSVVTSEAITPEWKEITSVTDTATFLKSFDSLITEVETDHILRIEGHFHEAIQVPNIADDKQILHKFNLSVIAILVMTERLICPVLTDSNL